MRDDVAREMITELTRERDALLLNVRELGSALDAARVVILHLREGREESESRAEVDRLKERAAEDAVMITHLRERRAEWREMYQVCAGQLGEAQRLYLGMASEKAASFIAELRGE